MSPMSAMSAARASAAASAGKRVPSLRRLSMAPPLPAGEKPGERRGEPCQRRHSDEHPPERGASISGDSGRLVDEPEPCISRPDEEVHLAEGPAAPAHPRGVDNRAVNDKEEIFPWRGALVLRSARVVSVARQVAVEARLF